MAENGMNDSISDAEPDSEIASLVARGVTALEDGRLEDAEAAFQAVVAREPDNADALRRLGVIAFMAGRYDDACGLLELSIGIAPDNADSHNNLGAVLLACGETTEAETHIRRALELHSDDPDIHFNLGLLLLGRGNSSEARLCFEAVIALRPEDADAHHNLGMAWRAESGRAAVAAAEAALRRALTFDGEHGDSLLELATLLREEGCLKEALETSELALAANRGDPAAEFNHGAVLYEHGRYQEAAKYFQRVIDAQPENAGAHDYLGRARAGSGDVDGAARAFRRGLERVPGNYDLTRNMRNAYSRMAPSWYLSMLNNSAQNEIYRAVIEKTVTPDDVVLDIGANSGLLAMMAARAGARRVIACEMLAPMAEMARRIIARNGYEDTITVVTKQPNELVVGEDLPEPASLVIAENLDVTLIGEGVIPALRHVTRRLIRPNARVIPARARIWGMLIEWPGERVINPIGDLAGFDYSELDLFRNPRAHVPFDEMRETHRVLSDPFEIARFDFSDPPDYSVSDTLEVRSLTATQTGAGHAVTVWFELDLDDEFALSTRGETNLDYWHRTAQFLDRDLPVRAGEEFQLTIRRSDLHICFDTAG